MAGKGQAIGIRCAAHAAQQQLHQQGSRGPAHRCPGAGEGVAAARGVGTAPAAEAAVQAAQEAASC